MCLTGFSNVIAVGSFPEYSISTDVPVLNDVLISLEVEYTKADNWPSKLLIRKWHVFL